MPARTPSDAPGPPRPLARQAFEFLVWALLAGAAQAGSEPAAEPTELPSLEDLLRTERQGAAAELSVSTASRQAQSADLAPAVTHVVSRQDIDRLGLRNLGDVLRRMPGLEVRQDAEFTRVAVRGVAPGDFNGRVLFLLDGLRLNDNIYDGGQIDREFLIDISLVERVEFTPGPGSALYGGNALLGVVNVVTQRADTLAGPQLRLAWSPRGQVSTRLSYGQRLDSGAEWLAAFSNDREPHPPLSYGEPPEDRSQLQPFERDRAHRWLLSGRMEGFSLRVGGAQRERSQYGFLPKSQDLTGVLDTVSETFAQGGWEGRAGDWDLHLGLAWQRSRYRSEQADDQLDTLRTSRFEALGRWWLGEMRLARAWGGANGDSHTTTAGLDWQQDATQRFRYVYLGEPPDDSNFSDRRLGFYVQDEWRLADRQRLVLGLRRDGERDGDARWSPRAAWVWSPAPGQSLKLLWGTAFRSANRFEQSLNEAYQQPEPSAERLRTTELAWEGPLAGLPWGAWQWQSSLFASHLVGLIERGSGPYGNQPPANSHGIELGLNGRWGDGWQLQLSAMGQRYRAADGGRQAYSPSQTLKWALQMPLRLPTVQTPLRLSFSGWATSERLGGERLPGYAQHQAQLLWQPSRHWDCFVGVQNLTGRSYAESSGSALSSPLFREGRRWQLGLTWRGDGT